MILTKKVKIKIHSRNKKSLEEKYKIKTKKGDIIDGVITDLNDNSKNKIECECDFCGEKTITTYQTYLKTHNNGGFACSQDCINKKIKKIKLEKYGDENYCNIEKIKQTKLEKYGDENYNNNEQNKITNKEKYGVDYYTQTTDFKIKCKNINKEKYGVDFYSQSEEFKIKCKYTKLEKYGDENYNNRKKYNETCLEKYGSKTFVESDYYNENVSRKSYKQKKYFEFFQKDFFEKQNIKILEYKDSHFLCECNNKKHNYLILPDTLKKRLDIHHVEPCTICNQLDSHTSNKEKQLLDFIKENYDGEIISNSRKIINPYEIDIYLPELNLAYEFNGLYWHNELYKDKNYHQMKYELCKKQNIHLIQIWEDDWNLKQEIVKSMILNRLGKIKNKLFARKTKIKEITNLKTIKDFLNNNHIQGSVGSSIKIGLYYDGDLVSLMTFIKRKNDVELNRFCNKKNTIVVGGVSKLFNYFLNNYDYKRIISFSDRSFSNGKLYEFLNFKKENIQYSYWYSNNIRRFHKFKFRNEEKNKTLLKNKIYKIYTPGIIKYVYIV